MILSCPSCKTRFRIPDTAIRDEGRRVRCGSCGNIWHAAGGKDESHIASKHIADPASVNSDTDKQSDRFAKAAEEAISRFEPNYPESKPSDSPITNEPSAPSFDEQDADMSMETDEAETAPSDHDGDILSSIAETVERDAGDDTLWDNDEDLSFSETFDSDSDDEAEFDPIKQDVSETARRLSETASDDDLYGAAGVPALTEETGKRSFVIYAGWGLWAVLVIGLVSAITLMPQRLEMWWPPIGQLYAVFEKEPHDAITQSEQSGPPAPQTPDMPDEVFDIRIGNNPEWQAVGNSWALVVSGSITNQSDDTVLVPNLSLSLLDQNGNLLKRAPVRLRTSELTPRAKVPFEVRVDNAPAKTTGIIHEWEQRSAS